MSYELSNGSGTNGRGSNPTISNFWNKKTRRQRMAHLKSLKPPDLKSLIHPYWQIPLRLGMIRKLSWCCPKISFELLLARIDAQRKYFQPSIAAVKLILWKLPLNEFAQNDIFQQKNISFAARWNRRTFTCCSPRTRLKSIARSSHSSTATAAEQSPQLSSARSCGRSDGTRQREICRFGLYLSPKVSNCVTRFSKNSPLWQNFKRLWYCLEGLLSVGNIFDPTLAT